eukprot:11230.XXX_231132_230553_1 [CDS] Oithona nana genome sequencing.
MRFTAEISCFETAYDAENGKQRLLQRHFEADEASETVVVAVRGRRSLSVPPGASQRRVSSKRSMQRLTEDELLELYKMSYGGGRKSSKAAQEEEEVRKKMMRKPSRKISREGDYLVIQDRLGCIMSQTGAQQVHERRVLINSDEYNYVVKNM